MTNLFIQIDVRCSLGQLIGKLYDTHETWIEEADELITFIQSDDEKFIRIDSNNLQRVMELIGIGSYDNGVIDGKKSSVQLEINYDEDLLPYPTDDD